MIVVGRAALLSGAAASVDATPVSFIPPTSDVATNSWTTESGGATNLYQSVDEDAASDADFIRSAEGATAGQYYETAFAASVGILYTDGAAALYTDLVPTAYQGAYDPGVSTGHTAHYRFQRSAAPASNLTVSLRQGAATEIAAWAHTAIPDTWTQADQALTVSQADAITDYSDLRLRFAPTAGPGPAPTLVGDRGSAQSTVSAVSIAVAVSGANTAVGNYLVARVAVDNSGTAGTHPGLTVSDARGNTWTVATPAVANPNGTVNTGAVAYIAYARIATQLLVGDNVTFAWTSGPPAKAITLEEWSGIHDTSPVAVGAVAATGSSATMGVTITPTAANRFVLTALATEGPAGDTAPNDTDTTNGTWTAATRLSTGSGTAAANQTVAGASKAVTSAGAQTWDSTITTSDWAAVAIAFNGTSAARVQVSQAHLKLPTRPATLSATGTARTPAGVAATITGRQVVPVLAHLHVGVSSTLTGAGVATGAAYVAVGTSTSPLPVGVYPASTTAPVGATARVTGGKNTAGQSSVGVGVSTGASRDAAVLLPRPAPPMRARFDGAGARSGAGLRGGTVGVATPVGVASTVTGARVTTAPAVAASAGVTSTLAGVRLAAAAVRAPVGVSTRVAGVKVLTTAMGLRVGGSTTTAGVKLARVGGLTAGGFASTNVARKVVLGPVVAPVAVTSRSVGAKLFTAPAPARAAVGGTSRTSGMKTGRAPATVEAGAVPRVTGILGGRSVVGVAVASHVGGVKVFTARVVAPIGAAGLPAGSKGATTGTVRSAHGAATTAARTATTGNRLAVGVAGTATGRKVVAPIAVEVFAGAAPTAAPTKRLGVATMVAAGGTVRSAPGVKNTVGAFHGVASVAFLSGPAGTKRGAAVARAPSGVVTSAVGTRAGAPVVYFRLRSQGGVLTAWRATSPIVETVAVEVFA